jgi:hypothetical protein
MILGSDPFWIALRLRLVLALPLTVILKEIMKIYIYPNLMFNFSYYQK